MNRFIMTQLLRRKGRVVALALGIVVASVSFVLLTSSVATSQLQVTGTVAKNFRPAYDILVRPPNSFTRLEKEQGLVRANYLSGLLGGVTFKQYHLIKQLRGVQVAAPIANIGYTLPFQFLELHINRFLSRDPTQLYKLDVNWDANGGLSKYPDSPEYVYYTRENPLKQTDRGPVEQLPGGKTLRVCSSFSRRKPSPDDLHPFAIDTNTGMTCFSSRSPELVDSGTDYSALPDGFVGAVTTSSFPVFLAAIDPAQEERLVDFNKALAGGRLLRPGEGTSNVTIDSQGDKYQVVPVLASTKSYLDEDVIVSVERLDTPSPWKLRRRLASKDAYNFVTHARGHIVGSLHINPKPAYERFIRAISGPKNKAQVFYSQYWTAGPVGYKTLGHDLVEPIKAHNPRSTFVDTYTGAGWAPSEELDVGFRKLNNFQGSTEFDPTGLYGTPALRVVGRFDPNRLPGFSPLSKVPLETYYPPVVKAADEATRKALGANRLLPTRNLAGYIAQPPLMLTTLKGLKTMVDPGNFAGADPTAPLSVIRVRVAGVTGPDPLSRERIKRVATEIHNRTGLAVDITAGSSPHSLTIALPKGRFGQPPLRVTEGWVQKGVAVKFLNAVDKKSLVLFLLVLLVCILFLANASLASARSRRREIGTLLCVGWSRRDIFRVIVGELALVGVAAGLIGIVLAALLTAILSLHLNAVLLLLVLPISVLLAVAAGWLPARRAARATPMHAVVPAIARGGSRRRLRNLASVARSNSVRVPGRTLLGASGLFVGVAALTVLIALNHAFHTTLLGTLLGNAISVQVRGVDFLSVALLIALGALGVADVLYLNLTERQAELATLRTCGWQDRDVSFVIALEGTIMGLVGCVLGAALGVAGVSLIHGISLTPIIAAGGVAAVVGLVATVVGSLVPAMRFATATPVTILAEE